MMETLIRKMKLKNNLVIFDIIEKRHLKNYCTEFGREGEKGKGKGRGEGEEGGGERRKRDGDGDAVGEGLVGGKKKRNSGDKMQLEKSMAEAAALKKKFYDLHKQYINMVERKPTQSPNKSIFGQLISLCAKIKVLDQYFEPPHRFDELQRYWDELTQPMSWDDVPQHVDPYNIVYWYFHFQI